VYRAKVAVCYEINIKHIRAICGQNIELIIVKLQGTKGNC